VNNPYIWPRATTGVVRKIRLGYVVYVSVSESGDEYDDEYGDYLTTEDGYRLVTGEGDGITP
jgi:hypothetical protein